MPLESTLVVDMLTQHVEGHAQEKGYLDANWSHTSEVRPLAMLCMANVRYW